MACGKKSGLRNNTRETTEQKDILGTLIRQPWENERRTTLFPRTNKKTTWVSGREKNRCPGLERNPPPDLQQRARGEENTLVGDSPRTSNRDGKGGRQNAQPSVAGDARKEMEVYVMCMRVRNWKVEPNPVHNMVLFLP